MMRLLPTPLTTVDSDVSDEQTTEDRNVGENENREEDSRYPKRIHTKPKHLDGYVLDGGLEDDENYTVDCCYRVANIPTTYDDALKSNEATKWQKAVHDEMRALYDNDTFELVTLPEGRQIVGGIKTGPEREEIHKARYVAKGYLQIAEIDYQETFAPTARMSSVRMLMQQAVQNNMITHQMDVKTAYLNAPIDCDIYIQQPEGFEKVGKMAKHWCVS